MLEGVMAQQPSQIDGEKATSTIELLQMRIQSHEKSQEMGNIMLEEEISLRRQAEDKAFDLERRCKAG